MVFSFWFGYLFFKSIDMKSITSFITSYKKIIKKKH